MIVRILVVDPNPRHPKDDIIVYQVPENSRAQELLIEMLERCAIEHEAVSSTRRPQK